MLVIILIINGMNNLSVFAQDAGTDDGTCKGKCKMDPEVIVVKTPDGGTNAHLMVPEENMTIVLTQKTLEKINNLNVTGDCIPDDNTGTSPDEPPVQPPIPC
jgi:hypothetical protein